MYTTNISRLVQMAAITLTIIAVCQELEKPPEKRTWHGSVSGIPYEFRFPSIKRIMDTYWNPYEMRVFAPTLWGVGWGINFHALLEGLRVMRMGDVSEKKFLMPTSKIEEVIVKALER